MSNSYTFWGFLLGAVFMLPFVILAYTKGRADAGPEWDDEDLSSACKPSRRPAGAPRPSTCARTGRKGRPAMKAADLAHWRLRWGLTQEELAARMGLGRRAFIELEMGRRPIRRTHVLALERISLDVSIIRNDAGLLMPTIKHAVNHAAPEPAPKERGRDHG
ncbi:helix-turn-helix domain-containing protein [Ancylobacter sp. SL191]|uniref:helix-turn-helix domain-containing protein n=1 Tax=Ancylobacter sp. SL191 TaxID=2995166 RepID=UPI002271DF33|nr:helix-turn-helix transcriptional regulator [Ancylobacter sp. SL191]WAC26383.1 helix-turn-helix transcriptional regulator [Ancylobacter sp. SL191]